MAALDVIVERLVSVWRKPAVRRSFPGTFVLLTTVGSVLKETELVPETYFSSSGNFLNLYFVKVSWGWTLLLLTPFLLLSNSSFGRGASFLVRRLLALAVATAVWFVCTRTFFYIEDATGSCSGSGPDSGSGSEFTSKSSCRRAGLHWQGYDISGHSFILAYSSLFIVEETAPMAWLKSGRRGGGGGALGRAALGLLYLALNLLVALWLWMFACTSVYFHEAAQKWLGTGCALAAWYLTYRVWYLRPWSPGLPPHRHHKEKKQNF